MGRQLNPHPCDHVNPLHHDDDDHDIDDHDDDHDDDDDDYDDYDDDDDNLTQTLNESTIFSSVFQFEHFNIGRARLKAGGVCWFVSILVIFYWHIGSPDISLAYWQYSSGVLYRIYAPIPPSQTIDTQ